MQFEDERWRWAGHADNSTDVHLGNEAHQGPVHQRLDHQGPHKRAIQSIQVQQLTVKVTLFEAMRAFAPRQIDSRPCRLLEYKHFSDYHTVRGNAVLDNPSFLTRQDINATDMYISNGTSVAQCF